MSRHKISLFIAFLSTFPFFACGHAKDTELVFLELSHEEVVFWPEAGEKIIEVKSNAKVKVESTDWIFR